MGLVVEVGYYDFCWDHPPINCLGSSARATTHKSPHLLAHRPGSLQQATGLHAQVYARPPLADRHVIQAVQRRPIQQRPTCELCRAVRWFLGAFELRRHACARCVREATATDQNRRCMLVSSLFIRCIHMSPGSSSPSVIPVFSQSRAFQNYPVTVPGGNVAVQHFPIRHVTIL